MDPEWIWVSLFCSTFIRGFFYARANFTHAMTLFNRMKVDLTKYIEEHLFSFDNAYSEEADNEQIY